MLNEFDGGTIINLDSRKKVDDRLGDETSILFNKYFNDDLTSLGRKYFLSNRAQNILEREKYSIIQFIELPEFLIRNIRNCGIKTTEELLQFQTDIIKDVQFDRKNERDDNEMFVLKLKEAVGLSNRAKRLLSIENLTVKEFIELSKHEIIRFRNCGIKTAKELIKFQNVIIASLDANIKKYSNKEDIHVSDMDGFYELSDHAKYILKEQSLHVSKFLSLSGRDVYRLKNCGAKIAEELIKFQYKLMAKKEEYLSVEGNIFIKKRLKEIRLGFSKPVQHSLEKLGLEIGNPMSWNLEDHKDKYSISSKIIRTLSEFKVMYFHSINQDINYDELSADLTLLPEYYKKYKDLPFVAALFRIDVSEAARRLKSIRKLVRQASKMSFDSLIGEIEYLLPRDVRNNGIFLARIVPWGKTLEEIGDIYGVTRERVRQIEVKTRSKIIKLYDIKHDEVKYLQKEFEELNYIGENLSIELLRKRYLNVYVVNAVIGILLSLSEEYKYFLTTAKLINKIPKNSSINIRQSRILDNISGDIVRKIRRIVLNSGAIHKDQVQDLISGEREDINPIMSELGYKVIEANWYSFKNIDLGKRAPLLNSMVKILKANSIVPFDKAFIGMQKHANRMRFILAPQNILKKVMQDYSCIIDNSGIISTPKEYINDYNGVEHLYMEYLHKEGPLVTFWDLYKEIVEKNGYSFPTLSSSLLRISPVVERIDSGSHHTLYTVIGWVYTEEDKKEAIDRLPKIHVDIDFKRTLDGLRLELSVGLWLITSGVICITGYDVPEGEWDVSSYYSERIKAVVNDNFIYGLSKIIRSLNLEVGDRISIDFNIITRRANIKKVLN